MRSVGKRPRNRLEKEWLARLGLNQRPLPCQGVPGQSGAQEFVTKNSAGQWEIADTSSVYPAIEWKDGVPRVYSVVIPNASFCSDKSVTPKKRRAV